MIIIKRRSLCVSVVELLKKTLTTEAQRSTENHRDELFDRLLNTSRHCTTANTCGY